MAVAFECGARLEPATLALIASNFAKLYRERHGRIVPGVPAEALTWRVRATAAGAPDAPGATGSAAMPAPAARARSK